MMLIQPYDEISVSYATGSFFYIIPSRCDGGGSRKILGQNVYLSVKNTGICLTLFVKDTEIVS